MPDTLLARLRARLRRYPHPDDTPAVTALCSEQWAGIAERTDSYLFGYRDRPNSDDRAQRRARWLARKVVCFADRSTDVESVLELGCACGRNLAEIYRAAPWVIRFGIDINEAAIREAEKTVPHAHLICADLHAIRVFPQVEVVFTCGVLGHLPPATLSLILTRMLAAAPRLVLVEEVGEGESEVLKGPRSWRPSVRATGPYALWKHPIPAMLRDLGANVEVRPLPEELRAPAATHLVTVSR